MISIDVQTVTAVLLVDGWHRVEDHSFSIDAYVFADRGEALTVMAEQYFRFVDRADHRPVIGPVALLSAVQTEGAESVSRTGLLDH